MKLGLALGYFRAEVRVPVERVQLAERLGFDSVWVAEAYGADSVTPLAYLAAFTERIRLGTAVMQLAARTPANCAMSMATVDALAGGKRAIAGLGVSGPQIVEGWYGQPWGRPYYRLKDYVTIMKKILARDEPVVHEGPEISLPYTGPGSSGLGKPLKSILHTDACLPIFVGATGASTIRLAAELCDGLLPMGFVPRLMSLISPWIEEGFRRSGGRQSWNTFEVQPSVTVTVTDDVKAAFEAMKPHVALTVGGMGHRDINFHKDAMIRRGYAEVAERIQELYLAGRKDEAAAIVPDEYCDEECLAGSPDRIRKQFDAWATCGISGLTIRTERPEAMEVLAAAAREYA